MRQLGTARSLACGLFAVALGLAAQARAVDGVIEINQARAAKGGVTPEDTPGFPVTISTGTFSSEPMSFRLTGPLFNSTNSNMIEIISMHVTVDLNGFAITCLLPSCNGMGISSTQQNVTVMNGTVRGYTEGVSVTGSGARVENVRAIGNGIGVHLGNSCSVHNTLASGNTDDGINVGAGCTVSGNTADSNGGDGISTTVSCNVVGNTVRGNTGHGLSLATNTGYSSNVVSTNTAGTVLNGVPAGGNVCNGTTVCP
jgi:parallel beta-helix repeat protein